MPTLPNMGLITPTLKGDTGVWDAKLNALAGLVDAHDHSSGKGVKVTPSGLNINADLTFGGNAATALGNVAFTPVAALAAGSVTLFVNTSDNELYWRTAGGANVKLTAGSSINTTLVGGIVGDYTAVGAQVAYDNANTRYTFKGASATGWSKLASGALQIYDTGTSKTVYLGMKCPAALAVSYDVTWPATPPGALLPVQMATDGTLSAPTSMSVPTITYTTDLKYSAVKFAQIPLMFNVKALTNCAQDNAGNFVRIKSSAGNWFWESCALSMIGMNIGDRLIQVSYTLSTTAAGTYNFKYYKTDGVTITAVDSWTESGVGGQIVSSRVIATPESMLVGWIHWLEINGPNNTPDYLLEVHVKWDRP